MMNPSMCTLRCCANRCAHPLPARSERETGQPFQLRRVRECDGWNVSQCKAEGAGHAQADQVGRAWHGRVWSEPVVRASHEEVRPAGWFEPGRSVGRDTATGTDPDAKWSEPGYEDKSLGQAVNQDAELVDRLVQETRGDLDAAEARFNEESAGAPALDRQRQD